MNNQQKLLLAVLCVLANENMQEASVVLAGLSYDLYKVVETSDVTKNIDIGIGFVVKKDGEVVYEGFWWTLLYNGEYQKDRTEGAVETVLSAA